MLLCRIGGRHWWRQSLVVHSVDVNVHLRVRNGYAVTVEGLHIPGQIPVIDEFDPGSDRKIHAQSIELTGIDQSLNVSPVAMALLHPFDFNNACIKSAIFQLLGC